MSNVEILQALAELQRDLNQAGTLLSQVVTKLNAVSSQLMENMRTQPATVVPEAAAPAPAPEVPPVSQQRPPALEVAQETLRAFPTGPTEEARAPEGPTEEAPAAGEHRQAVLAPTERKEEQLGHFRGSGSLFARYLSPEVITTGKGFLRAGVAGLKQYVDDAMRIPPNRLLDWPTGFYRDTATSHQQFLIQTTRGAVLLDGLPEYETHPLVVLRSPLPSDRVIRPIDELEIMDVLFFKEALQKALNDLNEQVI